MIRLTDANECERRLRWRSSVSGEDQSSPGHPFGAPLQQMDGGAVGGGPHRGVHIGVSMGSTLGCPWGGRGPPLGSMLGGRGAAPGGGARLAPACADGAAEDLPAAPRTVEGVQPVDDEALARTPTRSTYPGPARPAATRCPRWAKSGEQGSTSATWDFDGTSWSGRVPCRHVDLRRDHVGRAPDLRPRPARRRARGEPGGDGAATSAPSTARAAPSSLSSPPPRCPGPYTNNSEPIHYRVPDLVPVGPRRRSGPTRTPPRTDAARLRRTTRPGRRHRSRRSSPPWPSSTRCSCPSGC